MREIAVFLGPSLPQASALAELDADYLPPVVEGDICRLLRKPPRVIAIIDGGSGDGSAGGSGNAPQIGHKEIMSAMEQGIHVFGGAGIGALRAVELRAFGMRGAGWVYEAFRNGALEQDDEIAAACDGVYRRLSEPMVNVRHTLLAAARARVISEQTHDLLTARAKVLFYPRRTWAVLLSIAEQDIAPTEAAALRGWLPSGRVDQVARDAVTLLRAVREFLAADPPPLEIPWKIANTIRWSEVRQRALSTG